MLHISGLSTYYLFNSIYNVVILKSIVKFADKNICLGLYGIELDLGGFFSDSVCGGAVASDICRRCKHI